MEYTVRIRTGADVTKHFTIAGTAEQAVENVLRMTGFSGTVVSVTLVG